MWRRSAVSVWSCVLWPMPCCDPVVSSCVLATLRHIDVRYHGFSLHLQGLCVRTTLISVVDPLLVQTSDKFLSRNDEPFYRFPSCATASARRSECCHSGARQRSAICASRNTSKSVRIETRHTCRNSRNASRDACLLHAHCVPNLVRPDASHA